MKCLIALQHCRHLACCFKVVPIFKEKHPTALFYIVKCRRTALVVAQGIVNSLKSRFKCHQYSVKVMLTDTLKSVIVRY